MWRRDSGPRNLLMTLGGGERLSNFVGTGGCGCRSLGPGHCGHRPRTRRAGRSEETAEKNAAWPRVTVRLGFGAFSYRTPGCRSLRTWPQGLTRTRISREEPAGQCRVPAGPVFSPPCRQWPCTHDLRPGGEGSGREARSADNSTPACGVHSSRMDSAECPASPALTVNLEAKGPDNQAHLCLQRAQFPVRTKDSSKETGTCSDYALTTET